MQEIILGIKSVNRLENAEKIQKVLTKFGCHIGTRIGINPYKYSCSDKGLILIEVLDKESSIKIQDELLNITGTEIQRMEFDVE